MNARGATVPVEQREFAFSEADFQRVRALIRQRAGISLGPEKQDMVYSRLARRLRSLQLRRFTDYLDRLEAGDEAEWEAFTNALTTNLTSFFREPHHFPILAEHLRKVAPGHRATIWCCACSSGEEAYSIAMTAAEAFGTLTPPVTLIATDIDTQVLRQAQAGVYSAERVARLSAERVNKFFECGTGPQAGEFVVRPELRKLVSFRVLNLLEERWSVRGPLDAVFCRNVMIYFDRPTQERILRRLVPLMRWNGLLFAGHSENLFHVSDALNLLGKTVYTPAQGVRAGAAGKTAA